MDEILKPCDVGWHLKDHQCWYFDYDEKTWDDAWATCAKMGAILPTLYDKNTEDDFYTQINTATAWLGLNDKKTVGKWEWAELEGSISVSPQ